MWAQTNSWTGPASGNWEDPDWSLGVLPGAGQTIMFTNAGFKAVEIGLSTVESYPQTLQIESLTVSSPPNAANTLLMNYAGVGTPLVIGTTNEGSLTIADTNSTFYMFSSALEVRDSGGGEFATGAFSVEGTFNETTGSQVTAGLLNVGDVGTGVYNLTNSFLTVPGGGNELVGSYNGSFNNGTFNQQGGTNSVGSPGYIGSIGVGNSGTYNLMGGYLHTGVLGVEAAPEGAVNISANFNQSGGYNLNDDGTSIEGTLPEGSGPTGFATYSISGGTLVTSQMQLMFEASFHQSGGVVQAFYFTSEYGGGITITDGSFAGQYGGISGPGTNFEVDGGTVQIFDLSLNLNPKLVFTGGQTTVQTLTMENTTLVHTGGTLNIGTNSISSSSWQEQVGGQFGFLQLSGLLNLGLSASNDCVIQFANSSGLQWSNSSSPLLDISNWNGSLSGGGRQQIFFGSDFSGLTTSQLQLIQFVAPAGLPSTQNAYPARILATGEIVPYQPAKLSITNSGDALQIALQGQANESYAIQFSSNLMNWITLTNESSSNGLITVIDPLVENVPARFYRAVLAP